MRNVIVGENRRTLKKTNRVRNKRYRIAVCDANFGKMRCISRRCIQLQSFIKIWRNYHVFIIIYVQRTLYEVVNIFGILCFNLFMTLSDARSTFFYELLKIVTDRSIDVLRYPFLNKCTLYTCCVIPFLFYK